MEAPNFKWALPNVAILGLPDHPKMYEWLLQQGISTLYSIHPQVPKQIKAVPKLQNIHVRKYPYEQLKCDELLSFVEKINDARHHGKKIAFHDADGTGHAAMIVAAYLQKEHPIRPAEILEKVREIQPGAIPNYQQEECVLKNSGR